MTADFQDRMAIGKTLAQDRRNRGMSTGKAAAGWNRKPQRPQAEKGSWAELVQQTKWRMQHAIGEAAAEYDWQVRGQFVGDIPFFSGR